MGGSNLYCVRKVTDDITWVGGNDRRINVFEGVYHLSRGMTYNSYVILDEKTVLVDTVDHAVSDVFFENVAHVLGGRKLDYIIVQHMEPDHSATLGEVLLRYPEARIVCSKKAAGMIDQFIGRDVTGSAFLAEEGTVLDTGRHQLTFVMAPMVHWPEVMVTYDAAEKLLFSADAFGTFGAINGALFADEVDFAHDYMDRARSYYCNIVGKYGAQVQALLKKADGLDIQIICPLHGFVWRKDLGVILEKYQKWSTYEPEERGVVIAYASVYGGTKNACEVLACRLHELGVKTVVYDVSVTPEESIVSAAFRWSHLVFASTTYNAGVFIRMDEALRDVAAHGIRGRTVAFIENGSWAPTSAKQMREILAPCKDITFLDQTVTVRSRPKEEQREALYALADALKASVEA